MRGKYIYDAGKIYLSRIINFDVTEARKIIKELPFIERGAK